MSERNLRDGDVVSTDAGELRALATPGHTPDHLAFHWPEGDAVFVGDLLLGGMDSALVAPPDGSLADYLDSLERVRATGARRALPAHGEPIEELADAVDRYVRHRHDRLDRVRHALEGAAAVDRTLSLDEVVDEVYGARLEPSLREAAAGAARAYLDYLVDSGGARRAGPEHWTAGAT